MGVIPLIPENVAHIAKHSGLLKDDVINKMTDSSEPLVFVYADDEWAFIKEVLLERHLASLIAILDD